jgi:glycosyltransferase involved in cell wall biosynthesis
MLNVKYLCLQATKQGQASYSHVHEIINGLRKRNCFVELFEPKYAQKDGLPSLTERLYGIVETQFRAILSKSNSSEIWYLRSHYFLYPVALWAKIRGIKVVQEINGPYKDAFLAWPQLKAIRWLLELIMRQQLRWADAVVTVTPQLVEWVKQESQNSQVVMIANGANTELFDPKALIEIDVSFSPPYVIFFGSLAPWQGIEVMLEATASDIWPKSVSLVIVGDGQEKERVLQASRDNPLIHYLGSLPQHHLPGLIANAIASLSPQIGNRNMTGVFPLKLFESLACGVPVIVSDYPGMADFVKEHSCGLIVSPGSSLDIARSVALLHEDTKTRGQMAITARQIVEREHSWDMRANDTFALLQAISLCRTV